MNVEQALNAADEGEKEGLCGLYPMAAQVLAAELRMMRENSDTDRRDRCSWFEGDDGGPWATQCNELFNIENEGPEANGMRFCCFCGKKLVEVADDTEDENL